MNLQWFKDRINKGNIYRDSNGCGCDDCREILNEGFEIINEAHAEYIYKSMLEYEKEGIHLNYRDEK